MAARKKRITKPTSDAESARAFAVVLEQIHGKMDVFGEGLALLRESMTRQSAEVSSRFDQIDRRFDAVDLRFEQIDRRFEQIDHRFEQVDRRFEQIDRRFEQMDQRFDRVEEDLRDLRTAVDRKVDRDEVEGIVERAVARAVGH